MRANVGEVSSERWKDYKRQQERLKAMTLRTEKAKTVTADAMIENLLKQNLRESSCNPSNFTDNYELNIPDWLESESLSVPEAYKTLWSIVKTSSNLADTEKVSQLLLTSGLQLQALGFIWNLSNKAVPGHLNKQEFYIVLALVGLAQSGHAFHNLSILNTISTAPIPILQMDKCSSTHSASNSYLTNSQAKRSVNEHHFTSSQLLPTVPNIKSSNNDHPLPVEVKHLGKAPCALHVSKEFIETQHCNKDSAKVSNFPCIGSSPTAELDNEDDFSEFQSATIYQCTKTKTFQDESVLPCQTQEFTNFHCANTESQSGALETTVVNQKKETLKVSLPKNMSGKLSNIKPNILKISPESEKKLKVLSHSESLSSLRESKISSNNKVSTKTNVTVLGDGRDIGMRLACRPLSLQTEKLKRQKQFVAEDKSSAAQFHSMDELFPKCFQKNSGNSSMFMLKETKINSIESEYPESEYPIIMDNGDVTGVLQPCKNTRKIEIPMLGTFNETTLPTQLLQHDPTELLNVQEDKYSALREAEVEFKKADIRTDWHGSTEIDDFGEFFSADIPSHPSKHDSDLWGKGNNTNYSKLCPQEVSGKMTPFNSQSKEDDNDVYACAMSFDLLKLNEEDNIHYDNPRQESSTLHEVSFENNKESPIAEESLAADLKLDLNATTAKDEEYNCADSLQLKASESSQISSDSTISSTRSRMTIGSGLNLSYGLDRAIKTDSHLKWQETSERQDSLPSMDLYIMQGDTDSSVKTRKKCLEACLNLMQQAYDIFTGISTLSVLDEVFATQETVEYLNCLNILYQISKRILSNHGEISYFRGDIEKIWQQLINYSQNYKITLKEDIDNITGIGIYCNLCSGFVGSDSVHQEAPQIRFPKAMLFLMPAMPRRIIRLALDMDI